jgi:DNA-binding CsgD family transcriptional regulator
MKFDACVRQIFRDPGPFAWSALSQKELTREARNIIAESADADAKEGFVVPVIGGGGEFYGVRLSSPDEAFDQSARPTLHALATVYAFEGVKLLELVDDVETHTPLTRRETECLKWVDEGKSDWDISEILAISEATVHAHIENAKKKMALRSRVQAAVVATVRGWLTVNPPN